MPSWYRRVLVCLRVKNNKVIKAETFVDLPLVRSSSSKNNKKPTKRLKTVPNTLAKVKTFTVSFIDSPFGIIALHQLETTDIVASLGCLAATNVKFIAY